MTLLAEKVLIAEMSPHSMACAVTVVSFGLTLRVNEILGWEGHELSLECFDIVGWICRFSGGSRNAGSNGPRQPFFKKFCVPSPHLLHRLLNMMYALYPAWLGDA